MGRYPSSDVKFVESLLRIFTSFFNGVPTSSFSVFCKCGMGLFPPRFDALIERHDVAQ